MSERMLVAGNWKMNTSVSEGVNLAGELREAVDAAHADVAVLPPFTHLVSIGQEIAGSGIALGAQDCFWEPKGAFTGEISVTMLAGLCEWVLVGHSERRHIFGETDSDVTRKVRAALEAGLKVIAAVGETQEERDADETFTVIDRQLSGILAGCQPSDFDRLAIAYEPVWAIGTGRTATPEQAEEVCHRIAGGFSGSVRVLYGGSVTAANAAELFEMESISGALVGGASLKAQEFAAIVAAAR